MKKSLLIGLFGLVQCATTLLVAQNINLKFNRDGKFKIVQFTDVHMKAGNSASDIALERIKTVTEAEKPNLIIFTGDITTSGEAGLKAVLEEVEKQKTPYIILFGNHDDEHGSSRADLYNLMKNYPYNMNEDYLKTEDQKVLIYAANGKDIGAVLYCFDSHSYAQTKEVGGYAWLTHDQVHWYRTNSMELTANNNNKPLPSLAFFHIPLPEFKDAANDESAPLYGIRMERSAPPKINTGMFSAMRAMGDVMGVFVGHDHDNDYAVMWHDIVLAYGRYTGGNTVYNNLSNGGRVIVLEKDKRTFTSWIHTEENSQQTKVTYPDSFIRKNK